MNDGRYRCPNSQQGYSPFSTWTRGLVWAILGFAEQLEFLDSLADWGPSTVEQEALAFMLRALRATCDFYLENTAADGLPYWDTGAPGLDRLGDWRGMPGGPLQCLRAGGQLRGRHRLPGPDALRHLPELARRPARSAVPGARAWGCWRACWRSPI